ncbi:MAG: tRNA adenosine(34) deaminase TadA [Gammaproteobacteria bacterium]|nr:tRNA adenosine(34) deaminase TadA [Gammaproteobacteria bacterium]
MFNYQDNLWMQRALELARTAEENNEVPVGAVLVLNDTVIGEGHNHSIYTSDPTAHAEILALRAGAKYLSNYRLPQTTLYITLEPCVMCLGAIIHARINRVVYGAKDPKGGAIQSAFQLADNKSFNHFPIFTNGLLEKPCSDILSQFFRRKRQLKK